MVKLNIGYNSPDWRAQVLSNLAATPFSIGRFTFPSVESALQGIKFSVQARREEVFAMRGLAALKAGRAFTRSITEAKKSFVYWDDQKIPYNSLEHRLLVAMFIHEKVRQNAKVQQALLETAGMFIFHDPGMKESPNTSLPEKFFIEVLLAQRKLLQRLKSL